MYCVLKIFNWYKDQSYEIMGCHFCIEKAHKQAYMLAKQTCVTVDDKVYTMDADFKLEMALGNKMGVAYSTKDDGLEDYVYIVVEA